MPQNARILIVDDDEDILLAGRLLLKRHFGEIDTTISPGDIPGRLSEYKYDVILLDMNFGAGRTLGTDGLVWLQKIQKIRPETVVILITAHSAVETAVEAMKKGATDFVEKPWQNEKLVATVHAGLQLSRSRSETSQLKQTTEALMNQIAGGGRILGQSALVEKMQLLIERSAPTDANVLIIGENGTGKELVAQALFRKSRRADQVFMSIDLGALSENLFESELFGHKKGAFTDAREDRVGRFEAANGGTLFLDEIGNIPLHLQTKLLTALEQRRVTPLGSNQPVSFDVRIISATNISRDDMTDENKFRPDFLYRLNTVEIFVPALRDRLEDIPELVSAFIEQYAKKYGRPVSGISDDALALLQAFDWPGNIRALKHSVERAIILAEGSRLAAKDFNLVSGKASGAVGSATASLKPGQTLEEVEKCLIVETLKRHQGNISRAAKELGLTRASLYRRMEKYGL